MVVIVSVYFYFEYYFSIQNAVKAEVNILLDLKAQYKAATGNEWKPQPANSQPSAPANSQTPDTMSNTPAEAEQLSLKVGEQGDKVRSLKSSGAAKVIHLNYAFIQSFPYIF